MPTTSDSDELFLFSIAKDISDLSLYVPDNFVNKT